ncbi:MAG: hypothetical protein SH850_02195 [Planctomycetaceae bacterium]|nr:hypothetical protein [Planctomycetaceae bacterium]
MALLAVLSAPAWLIEAVCDGSFDLRVHMAGDCGPESTTVSVIPIRGDLAKLIQEQPDSPEFVWLNVPCDGTNAATIRSGYSYRDWHGITHGFVREHEALLVRRGESQFDIIPFDYQLGQGDVDITIPVAHP